MEAAPTTFSSQSFFQTLAQSSGGDKSAMIKFNGALDSFPVKGDNVSIIPSPGDHDVGSSKLKITNISNFGWEFKYYSGQLVAVHKSGNFIAYGLLQTGKNTGVTRVIHRKTDERILLKGMKGKIKDMAFAHTTEENSAVLGIVDEMGNLFVFLIKEGSDKKLQYEKLLEVTCSQDVTHEHHRIIWCPYIPEEEETSNGDEAPDSSARLLVLTHDSLAEMWNIDMVINEYGNGPFAPEEVKIGRKVIADHKDVVTAASFSPDGTALATASADGSVKFFQVYMPAPGDEAPRCLHEWSPHDGKPLSSLFFLDNHRDHNPDVQFWKYAITGADFNSELKVWACETWTCLQTIRFCPQDAEPPVLKACLDLSAKFLLLSEINRKNIYILQLQQTSTGPDSSRMVVVSVSEFATPSPFLSISTVDAGLKRVQKEDIGEAFDEFDDLNRSGEGNTREATVVEFYLVQPKSLQECIITYDDAYNSSSVTTLESLTEQLNISVKRELNTSHENNGELQEAADKITLMSPEAFNSPNIKKEVASPVLDPLSIPSKLQQILTVPSGGSSPSREVQDILGDTDGHDLGEEVVITEGQSDFDEDDEDSDDTDVKANITKETVKTEWPIPAAPAMKNEWPADLPPIQIKKEPMSPEPEPIKPVAMPVTPLAVAPLPVAPLPIPAPIPEVKLEPNQVTLEVLFAKINEMSNLIQTQRSEVLMLRNELSALKSTRGSESIVHSVSKELATQINENLKRSEKTRHEAVLQSVGARLDNIVRGEFKKQVPSIMQQVLSSFQGQMDQQVTTRVANMDRAVRDAADKLLRSKIFVDTIAEAVTRNLQPVLKTVFHDTFASVVIPGFERASQNMFAQVSNVFNKGVLEYDAQLKQHMTTVRKEHAAAITGLCDPAVQEMRQSTMAITQATKAMSERIAHELHQAQERFVAVVRGVVANEMPQAVAAAVTSPHVSRSPSVANANSIDSIMANVKTYMREGNPGAAFQTALTANSLAVVVMTCEMVNPAMIFNKVPCPLSQPILLSLIQQLGHKLEDKTETKVKYLEEAVCQLDAKFENTRMHLGPVLNALHRQLTTYYQAHPDHRNIKVLIMAVQSVLKEVS